MPMNSSRPRLSWRSLNNEGQHEILRALSTAGITIADNADVLLVTTDDYLRIELQDIADNERRPWLLARPVGGELWIGPVFRRDDSTCWHCLAHWMRPRQRTASEAMSHQRLRPESTQALIDAALRFATGPVDEMTAKMTVVAANGLKRDTISVPARTRCSCHGPRANRASTVSVMNSAFGIVFDLDRHVPPPNHLHHAACRYVFPDVQRGTRCAAEPAAAFGRGQSPQAAVNSCVAEAIERYSAVWQGTEPMVLAQFEGDSFLAPESILLFSENQYRSRLDWNRSSDARFNVPHRFDRGGETYWSPVRSLLDGRLVLAPTALCYGGFDADSIVFGSADSIGCAAGPTLEDAVLAAVLEKIERDAVALWWYSKARRPRVDLSLINDRFLAQALEEARSQSILVQVLDVTTDIEVPSYVCVGTDMRGESPCFGAAAHPDPITAARRATTEMLQMHFWSRRSSLEPSVEHWLRTGSLKNAVHLQGGEVVAPPQFTGALPSLLQWTVDKLVGVELEPFVVDLTRPEIGLPVARVIIPGSRHCWNRLGPGRLYDVPARLGWVERSLLESELNPTPCPL